MNNPSPNRIRIHRNAVQAAVGVTALLMFSFTGCVAFNVPSQRHHDPNDHGGILGHWKSGVVDPVATSALMGHGHCNSGSCGAGTCQDEFTGAMSSNSWDVDGGALAVDPFDTSVGEHSVPEEPEIPWPRFHPVPTRPIFAQP